MVKSEMKTVKNQNGKEQIMKKEFKEIIEKYKGQVPDKVIEIWKNYGLGSFFEWVSKSNKFR